MYRMRIDPEKTVIHGLKLHMEAWSPFSSNFIILQQEIIANWYTFSIDIRITLSFVN